MKINISLHKANNIHRQWFYYLIPRRLTLKENNRYKWRFWIIGSEREDKQPEVFLDEHFVQATTDLKRKKEESTARMAVLRKRYTYFRYFDGDQRYGISFKEFNRRVDAGTWQSWIDAFVD